MAADAILEITKISISPQRFDRCVRNSVQWCKMVLLTTQTVKKILFQKSKLADGRHFDKKLSYISPSRDRAMRRVS